MINQPHKKQSSRTIAWLVRFVVGVALSATRSLFAPTIYNSTMYKKGVKPRTGPRAVLGLPPDDLNAPRRLGTQFLLRKLVYWACFELHSRLHSYPRSWLLRSKPTRIAWPIPPFCTIACIPVHQHRHEYDLEFSKAQEFPIYIYNWETNLRNRLSMTDLRARERERERDSSSRLLIMFNS